MELEIEPDVGPHRACNSDVLAPALESGAVSETNRLFMLVNGGLPARIGRCCSRLHRLSRPDRPDRLCAKRASISLGRERACVTPWTGE